MDTMVVSSNEFGHKEVRIEHDVTLLDIILFRSPKIEVFTCQPGTCNWVNKNTGKKATQNKWLEILDIIEMHDASQAT